MPTGNPSLVHAAGDSRRVRLDDAQPIACLLGEQDERRLERAAVRWLGRFALECPSVRIEDLRAGMVTLEALGENREGARRALVELCARHGWW